MKTVIKFALIILIVTIVLSVLMYLGLISSTGPITHKKYVAVIKEAIVKKDSSVCNSLGG